MVSFSNSLTNQKSGWTHFSAMFYFYTLWKRQKTKGFMTFSGCIEREHWVKCGWSDLRSPVIVKNSTARSPLNRVQINGTVNIVFIFFVVLLYSAIKSTIKLLIVWLSPCWCCLNYNNIVPWPSLEFQIGNTSDTSLFFHVNLQRLKKIMKSCKT